MMRPSADFVSLQVERVGVSQAIPRCPSLNAYDFINRQDLCVPGIYMPPPVVIARGRRLVTEERELTFEKVKKISPTLLGLLNDLVVHGWRETIAVLVMSISVSLPFFRPDISPGHETTTPSEEIGPSVTEELIIRVSSLPNETLPVPSAPSNLRLR